MNIVVGYGVWLSLVERYVRDVEAAGSNPVTPIKMSCFCMAFFLQEISIIEGTLDKKVLYIP